MPRLSAVAVRAALLHLLLGTTVGSLILWHKGLPLAPQLWRLLPAHRESLMIGWMVQLAFGVAYWVLPRFSGADTRPRPWLAGIALACLNLGVLLAAWVAPLGGPPASVAIGRSLELAAALMFLAHLLPRVKGFGA